MKLLSETIRAQLPKLYATRNEDDPLAYVKLDARWAGWTWYILEFDGHDVCYGYVRGFDREFGYFNLSEIESLRGPRHARVERNLEFTPTRLSTLKNTSG